VNAREATVAAALLLALGAGRASAQTFAIPWWTVDAGGHNGATAPGLYEFYTTAGQPDAGGPFTSATFAIHSGYWSLFAGAGGPQADLAVTVTDGQTTAVPGMPVTYQMTVSNLGPNAANGVWVFNDFAVLTGVTWTCTATPGSSCPASGTGPLNHFANVAISGTVAYTLTGTIPSSSSGTLTQPLLATVPPGTTDPDLSNNSASDVDVLTPQADLAVSVADGLDPVGPGMDFAYLIDVTNAGPSRSSGSTLTLALPGGVSLGVASPGCAPAGGIVTCDLTELEVGTVERRHVQVFADVGTLGPLAGSAVTTGNDPDPVASNDSDTEITTIAARGRAELTHGARIEADLRSAVQSSDPDFYAIHQDPHASYEVVVDGTSGDLTDVNGVDLALFEADATIPVVGSSPIGVGPSHSLRWINTTSAVVDQVVRVRSHSCTTDCGPEDVYRIRAWETTAFIPRFNNSGSQITVVLVQNAGWREAEVRLYFWSASGALLLEQTRYLGPKGLLSLNTSGFPELAGATGSITIASTAPYGTLAGKAVALEPSTGLCFDSPLTPKPR
jgi:uncharacterized protein DUF11